MLQTSPPQVATLSKAIKVTVDGPREPRSKTRHQAFHPYHFGPRPFPFGHPQDPLGFKLSVFYPPQALSLMYLVQNFPSLSLLRPRSPCTPSTHSSRLIHFSPRHPSLQRVFLSIGNEVCNLTPLPFLGRFR
ncbi:hypothetical protein KQX54_018687 [Cotesia glomerata]|uniref:Runt domain-containing protein n=1 Tax=Cotesia glomerata TaxID=32391 RepID=A0AAV7IB75_COTGL|nr:hypothetical protein KQX54_018687 [Cotesia glomerata]